MADRQLDVLVICGSLRKGSYNAALARTLPALAPAGLKLRPAPAFDKFPIYNHDIQDTTGFPAEVQAWADAIRSADGVIIVSPEYNNGYPGVLKNALDYLGPKEYQRKPFGIVTVSGGGFGGLHALSQLRLVTLGMGAFPLPASLPFSRAQDVFAEDGTLKEPSYEKRADTFIAEVLWFTEAIATQKAKTL